MKILVAPDSMKGSLSAAEFCQVAKEVLESTLPRCTVTALPMADGGEGTVAALVSGTGGRLVDCRVTGPLGSQVEAAYGLLGGDEKVAVVEMAAASGLPLVPVAKRNPLLTTSYGTGQLISHALGQGVGKIIIGLGGSATNDGGVGALQALGVRFLADNGEDIGWGGGALTELARINASNLDPRLAEVELQIACDVNNPLLGPRGATYTFGAQKGADAQMLAALEAGLENLAKTIAKTTGRDLREVPGCGAAGGMGFGLLSFTQATLSSGFELVAAAYDFDRRLSKGGFELIVTGEGGINEQSSQGKLVGRMAQLGRKYKIPVIALGGMISGEVGELYALGLTAMYSICPGPCSSERAMTDARQNLARTVLNLGNTLNITRH